MKLIRFTADKLNGYLNFDFVFDQNLSFLIGINGSGKTSVLKSIVSLITPDIDWLFNANYTKVSLTIDLDGEEVIISAIQEEDALIFTYASISVKETDLIGKDQYRLYARRKESSVFEDDGEVVRIQEFHAEFPQSNKAMSLARSIPTPIFLGLDRTTLPSFASQDALRARRMRRPRRSRSTIRAFLDESVAQAEALVGGNILTSSRERARLAGRLREDILLSLFSETSDETGQNPLPSKDEVKRLDRTRRSIKAAFSVMGLPASKVGEAVDPFFTELISDAEKLQNSKDVRELMRDDASSELREVFFRWLNRGPRLSLVSHVENLVNKFNSAEANIFSKIKEYLDLLNSFFRDSGKEVYQSEEGIGLRFSNGLDADIYQTSSGERQLFVLITNLMFNDDDKQANVLIIDEPELSLHLKWQETFVSAIRRANVNTQIILATHSPSIIMNYDDKCIDLSC